eukprot:comp22413_c0_seq1/m.54640 comp22413_c0_seq1/g.54640  ORF comp22413_c0_seq1/g.54640 comp22413_c0_seq1/m.54640 type:complete len:351 (-) comp22413_c0_seq1:1292-2344(-)
MSDWPMARRAYAVRPMLTETVCAGALPIPARETSPTKEEMMNVADSTVSCGRVIAPSKPGMVCRSRAPSMAATRAIWSRPDVAVVSSEMVAVSVCLPTVTTPESRPFASGDCALERSMESLTWTSESATPAKAAGFQRPVIEPMNANWLPWTAAEHAMVMELASESVAAGATSIFAVPLTPNVATLSAEMICMRTSLMTTPVESSRLVREASMRKEPLVKMRPVTKKSTGFLLCGSCAALVIVVISSISEILKSAAKERPASRLTVRESPEGMLIMSWFWSREETTRTKLLMTLCAIFAGTLLAPRNCGSPMDEATEVSAARVAMNASESRWRSELRWKGMPRILTLPES